MTPDAIVGGSDDELANAAGTCFLENLAEADHPFRPLLSEQALAYWKNWECGRLVCSAALHTPYSDDFLPSFFP